MLTIAVGIALALVFSIVYLVLRGQALERRFSELEKCSQRIAHEWTGPQSIVEEHEDFPEMDFTVFKPDGTLLASTSKSIFPFAIGRVKQGRRLFVGSKGLEINVVSTTSWTETEAGLKQLGVVLGGLWLPLVLLTAGITWLGGGMVLRPVTELVRSADSLASGTGHDRLETTDRAEYSVLAESLNTMIAKIRQAAQVQEQFASDAAHELRSPLAVLRTRIETTLLNDRSGDQYRDDLKSMLPKVDRLTAIVETLLASARNPNAVVVPLDLNDVLPDMLCQWILDTGWDSELLKTDLAPAKAMIPFEELRMVLGNLLDNAAQHSPAGQPILVTLKIIGQWATLTVKDFGPGLSDEGRSHAFDRFYRSEEDRNRSSGGSGIGLAVVKRIIESRHGRVSFKDVTSGAEVEVTLPVAP